MKIKDRVKEYRLKKGLTQVEMANLIGISQPALSCYESGETKPDIVYAIKLAALFGISIEELMKEE